MSTNATPLGQINVEIASQRALTMELDKQAQQIKQRLIQLQHEETELLGPDYTLGCQLIDAQGYPIPVDLYAVRQCRNEAIRLVNDHKALTARIETEMLKTFQLIGKRDELGGDGNDDENNNTNEDDTNHDVMMPQATQEAPYTSPFLRIDLVLDDTPASEAGLCDGDQIVLFGEINADEFESGGLTQLIKFVQEHEDIPIKIIYLHHETYTITVTELTPKRWSGQGLLGCKVIPL